MRRSLGLILALMMTVGIVAGCGGDDESSDSGSATTAASSSSDSGDSGDSGGGGDSGDSGGSSNTGNAKVDEYCDQVDEIVAAMQKVKDDPTSADAEKAGDQAKELSASAAGLIGELIADPDLADAVTDCTAKLQEVSLG